MLSKQGTTFSMPSVIMLLLISMLLGMTMVKSGYAQDEPALHLPVHIIRFQNVGNDGVRNTGVPSNTHHCVATSWSGRWDIQEDDAGNNYVWTQVRATDAGSRWFLLTSFRSHNDHESLDVDVVCFRIDQATYAGSPTLWDPD